MIEHLRRSKLIYLLGGSPQHLGLTLAESGSRQAILEAHKAGAVIGGSSAGAMLLCDHYYDPSGDNVFTGLGLVPGCCVLPHHDTFGQNWTPRLTQLLPEAVLIGIDEQTGMVDDAAAGEWQVYGKGAVTLYRYGHIRSFGPGRPFGLDPV
ncbi:MAG: Type 1 glutamine amidotransferase-like domain-containing protein [Deltaproteobacteria bacterium]|nr:MAG: Type 1 glutamine amidotransferase-like domain-containing protein [Deltaproteobacteria bacterium]